uniref:T-box domain-containing protein n=1 Tax=Strigamia maritima TaxID=126957 RepID=T1JHN9_STRMM
MASELSTRARAFSVEALLQDRVDAAAISPSSSDSNLSEPSPAESPESLEGGENPLTTGVLEIGGITVELCGRELWQQFYKLGTEMIITKAGRRMFPSLKIRVSGLDADSFYNVWLDIVPLDDKRYRYVYHSSQWMVAGSGDPPPSHNIYVHQESPAPGRSWMGQGAVTFDRLKLTNNRRPLIRGQVSLHSMHKYQPRIHIQKSESEQAVHLDLKKSTTFIFNETSFTTVTAYQNQQVKKVISNYYYPFCRVSGL